MYNGSWSFEGGNLYYDKDGIADSRLNEELDCWTAAYFLSGYSKNALNIWGDGEIARCAITGLKNNKFIYHKFVTELNIDWSGDICLSGPIVRSPSLLASFCQSYSSASIYVCPLVDELSSFGVLASRLNLHHKPYRANLYHENSGIIEDALEVMDFEDNLEGDCLGRMAHLVGNGVPVLNQVRTSVGVSPFYGKVLSDVPLGDAAYAIKSELVNLYFPKEPVSLKSYAATTSLVEVANTDKFKEVSKYEGDRVSILTISDYIYDLPSFIKFYVLIARKGFVSLNDVESLKGEKIVPVFRYNKGYKMGYKDFKRMFIKDES